MSKMAKKMKYLFACLVFTCCFFFLSFQVCFTMEQNIIPSFKIPLVVTTCGQSPAALNFSILCKRIKLPCDRVDLLKAEDLKAKAESGNQYKTLIITTGTSLKGMGAAGVNMDIELFRIKKLIEEAKKEGIVIVGAHIEGMARRVDETDAASIEAVIPYSNLIIIRADSNEDKYFDKLSEEYDIPMISVENTFDISDILKELFNIENE